MAANRMVQMVSTEQWKRPIQPMLPIRKLPIARDIKIATCIDFLVITGNKERGRGAANTWITERGPKSLRCLNICTVINGFMVCATGIALRWGVYGNFAERFVGGEANQRHGSVTVCLKR